MNFIRALADESLLLLYAIQSKLYNKSPAKAEKKNPENICEVNFSNRSVRLVNLRALFNNSFTI